MDNKYINTLLAVLALAISIWALSFSYQTRKIDDDRFAATEAKQKAASEYALAIKTRTIRGLEDYYNLIHTQRENYFIDLYDQLNVIAADSSNYLDVNFKNMLSNHTSMLQKWIKQKQDNTLLTDRQIIFNEFNALVAQNKQLYDNVCDKNNIEVNPRYFEGPYLY